MSETAASPSCSECGAPTLFGVADCGLCSAPTAGDELGVARVRRGATILSAGPAGGGFKGWQQHSGVELKEVEGPPAELMVNLPPHDGPVSVLSTATPYDDVELAVTIRFAQAQPEASAGIELRKSDVGNYVARLSPDGRFSVGTYSGPEWAGYLVPWTSHPAIRAGLGARNRLRVSGRGNQVRVFANGVLVTSLRDDRHPNGQWGIVGVAKAQLLEVGYSQLQLRDLP